MAARGKFITFEGGEGAGKTTHVRRLAARLGSVGIETITTREPGGSPGGEAIRTLLLRETGIAWSPLSEVLLHYAARREHIDKIIAPALSAGKWVLCDRFADSTMAYQGYGQGADRNLIEAIHRLIIGTFAPDLTFVLELPVEVGRERTRTRDEAGDRYEAMVVEVHERIRQGFLTIATASPGRCVVVDAAQPIDVVDAAITEALARRFELPAFSR